MKTICVPSRKKLLASSPLHCWFSPVRVRLRLNERETASNQLIPKARSQLASRCIVIRLPSIASLRGNARSIVRSRISHLWSLHRRSLLHSEHCGLTRSEGMTHLTLGTVAQTIEQTGDSELFTITTSPSSYAAVGSRVDHSGFV